MNKAISKLSRRLAAFLFVLVGVSFSARPVPVVAVGANVFTMNRDQLRQQIQNAGGVSGDWRLGAINETQTKHRFPGFFVWAAYRTNKSTSCYVKSWEVHFYNDDCAGNIGSSCPKNVNGTDYMSATDYFEYLCQTECNAYFDLTGQSCSDIVTQDEGTFNVIYREKSAYHTSVPGYEDPTDKSLSKNQLEFVVGDPVRLKLLRGAVEGLNDLLPYTEIDPQYYMSRVNGNQQSVSKVYSNLSELNVGLNDQICKQIQQMDLSHLHFNISERAMKYACTAYKTNKDSINASMFKQMWRNKDYSGCSDNKTSLASCKQGSYNYYDNIANNYANTANNVRSQISSCNTKISNEGACRSNAQAAINAAQADINSAQAQYNACPSGTAGDACRQSASNSKSAAQARKSSAQSQYNNCDASWCRSYVNTHSKAPNRPEDYDQKAAEYRAIRDESQKDVHYQYKWYYQGVNLQGEIGTRICLEQQGNDWMKWLYNGPADQIYFQCDYKNYVGTDQNYQRNVCHQTLVPQMLSQCKTNISDVKYHIARYRRKRDWATQTGTDEYFAQCHGNPDAAAYRGWKENDDGYPQTVSIDQSKFNIRCYHRARMVDNPSTADWSNYKDVSKKLLSLPGYIDAYIKPTQTVVRNRAQKYAETINDPAFKDSWRHGWCLNVWAAYSNPLQCTAVRTLDYCRRKVNKIIANDSGNDITHKSSGRLYLIHSSHWCNDGFSISGARCYKSACYVGREYCHNLGPNYVDSDESCSELYSGITFSERLVRGLGKNGNLTCKYCEPNVGSNCTALAEAGYRYDVVTGKVVYGDVDKNIVRYRIIANSCGEGDEKVNMTYNGVNLQCCLKPLEEPPVACDKKCSDFGLYDYSETSCTRGDNSCIDTAPSIYKNCSMTDPPKAKFWSLGYHKVTKTACGRTLTCYDAKCRPESGDIPTPVPTPAPTTIPVPSPNIDVCQLSGLLPNNWSCNNTKENRITCAQFNANPTQYGGKAGMSFTCSGDYAQITTYNALGNPITTNCVIGCALKDSLPYTDPKCEAEMPELVGAMIYKYMENQPYYKSLATWAITRGENIWSYTHSFTLASGASTSHTHQYRKAGNGMYIAEVHTDDAKVCGFDQCAPNNAKDIYDQRVKAFSDSNCDLRYNLIRKGAVYDGCDKIYEYNTCVPKPNRPDINNCVPHCRQDEDKGYGTYEAGCEMYGSTAKTYEDTCADTSKEVQTRYTSTIACNVPTCDAGYQLSIDVNKTMMPDDESGHSNIAKCGQRTNVDCNHRISVTFRSSGLPTNSKYGNYRYRGYAGRTLYVDDACYGVGGTYQCAFKPSKRDTSSSSCHNNGADTCYNANGCGVELDNSGNPLTASAVVKHPTEFGSDTACGGGKCGASDDVIFIPAGRSDTKEAQAVGYSAYNENYRAGGNGYRCGRYVHVGAVKYSTGGGNVYSDTTGDNVDQYHCAGATTVPLSSGSIQTASGSFDYNYFAGLVEINKLAECQPLSSINWANATRNADGHYICRLNTTIASARGWSENATLSDGSTVTVVKSSKLLDAGLLEADKNVTIFFDDDNLNFYIDTNIVTDQERFKGFIVKNKIIIDGNVGRLPAAAMVDDGNGLGCSTENNADLQGFFVAKDFDFQHGRIVARSELSPFNDIEHLYCDRQLVFAGSLVQYNNAPLKLNRTFKGCVGGSEDMSAWNRVMADPLLYPDFNSFISPVIFYQRADFNTYAPNWLKSSHIERQETN